jgi:hypothetical protein
VSYENVGSLAVTIKVSRLPDASGNYKCNGANDQVEILAAMTEAARRGGGDVVLGPGTYSINAQLTMPQYVRLLGSGQVAVTGSNNSTVFNIQDDVSFVYINVCDVAIHNILFYGHYETGRALAIRIEDTGTNIDNVQIKNCRFRGFRQWIWPLDGGGQC